MALNIRAIPILSDNYAWLLRDAASDEFAIVDPAEFDPVMKAIEAEREAGGRPAMILLTHHHSDHIDAAEAVRERTGMAIVGATADRRRLPRLDREVAEGDTLALGESVAQIIETPGHTRGHISYFFAATPALFCGDTLFSLGCGRLLEGSPAEMFDSLRRLATLPPQTLVCCGHEYTEANARFALAALPDDRVVAERAAEVFALRRNHAATLPVQLGLELSTNPFLRSPDLADFTRLRRWKDSFR